MSVKKKKQPAKSAVKHKKIVKQPVVGETEVFDFDFGEELLSEKVYRETAEAISAEAALDAAQDRKISRKASKKEDLSFEEDEIFEDSGKNDYMDFVPKKTGKGAAKKAAATAGAYQGVKKASGKKAAVSSSSVKKNSGKNRGKKRRKRGGAAEVDVMDRIIAATGVLVVLVGLMTAGIYSVSQSVEKQVSAMAEVGMKMEHIGIVGEGVITAVADARAAALEAAEYAQQIEEELSGEYEEKELSTEVKVGLKLTSVQRDLKIKFTNKNSGKLIGNQPFEVKIEGPEPMTKIDDDEDGIIYISNIKPGEYTVTILAPEEIDGSKVNGVRSLVTVKDKIE